MDGDNTAVPEERGPIFVGDPYLCIGLVTIQEEHVDGLCPLCRYLTSAPLINLHPPAETSTMDVVVKALPK
jgi:hypothetical protein